MAREEQIREAAEQYAWVGNLYNLQSAFTAGAKWADKNPKETNGKELLYVANQTAERTKKEVIGKFCEWLEDVDFEMSYIDSEGLFDKERFINDFRKAMEE